MIRFILRPIFNILTRITRFLSINILKRKKGVSIIEFIFILHREFKNSFFYKVILFIQILVFTISAIITMSTLYTNGINYLDVSETRELIANNFRKIYEVLNPSDSEITPEPRETYYDNLPKRYYKDGNIIHDYVSNKDYVASEHTPWYKDYRYYVGAGIVIIGLVLYFNNQDPTSDPGSFSLSGVRNGFHHIINNIKDSIRIRFDSVRSDANEVIHGTNTTHTISNPNNEINLNAGPSTPKYGSNQLNESEISLLNQLSSKLNDIDFKNISPSLLTSKKYYNIIDALHFYKTGDKLPIFGSEEYKKLLVITVNEGNNVIFNQESLDAIKQVVRSINTNTELYRFREYDDNKYLYRNLMRVNSNEFFKGDLDNYYNELFNDKLNNQASTSSVDFIKLMAERARNNATRLPEPPNYSFNDDVTPSQSMFNVTPKPPTSPLPPSPPDSPHKYVPVATEAPPAHPIPDIQSEPASTSFVDSLKGLKGKFSLKKTVTKDSSAPTLSGKVLTDEELKNVDPSKIKTLENFEKPVFNKKETKATLEDLFSANSQGKGKGKEKDMDSELREKLLQRNSKLGFDNEVIAQEEWSDTESPLKNVETPSNPKLSDYEQQKKKFFEDKDKYFEDKIKFDQKKTDFGQKKTETQIPDSINKEFENKVSDPFSSDDSSNYTMKLTEENLNLLKGESEPIHEIDVENAPVLNLNSFQISKPKLKKGANRFSAKSYEREENTFENTLNKLNDEKLVKENPILEQIKENISEGDAFFLPEYKKYIMYENGKFIEPNFVRMSGWETQSNVSLESQKEIQLEMQNTGTPSTSNPQDILKLILRKVRKLKGKDEVVPSDVHFVQSTMDDTELND